MVLKTVYINMYIYVEDIVFHIRYSTYCWGKFLPRAIALSQFHHREWQRGTAHYIMLNTRIDASVNVGQRNIALVNRSDDKY